MKNVVASLILWASLLALASTAFAQQESHPSVNNPLAVLLESKGILTPAEVASINQAASPRMPMHASPNFSWEKGLISQQEFASTIALLPPPQSRPSQRSPNLRRSVVCLTRCSIPEPKPESNAERADSHRNSAYARARFGVIPAVAPLRVLPIDMPKQGGMIPDIHLGVAPT